MSSKEDMMKEYLHSKWTKYVGRFRRITSPEYKWSKERRLKEKRHLDGDIEPFLKNLPMDWILDNPDIKRLLKRRMLDHEIDLTKLGDDIGYDGDSILNFMGAHSRVKTNQLLGHGHVKRVMNLLGCDFCVTIIDWGEHTIDDSIKKDYQEKKEIEKEVQKLKDERFFKD